MEGERRVLQERWRCGSAGLVPGHPPLLVGATRPRPLQHGGSDGRDLDLGAGTGGHPRGFTPLWKVEAPVSLGGTHTHRHHSHQPQRHGLPVAHSMRPASCPPRAPPRGLWGPGCCARPLSALRLCLPGEQAWPAAVAGPGVDRADLGRCGQDSVAAGPVDSLWPEDPGVGAWLPERGSGCVDSVSTLAQSLLCDLPSHTHTLSHPHTHMYSRAPTCTHTHSCSPWPAHTH